MTPRKRLALWLLMFAGLLNRELLLASRYSHWSGSMRRSFLSLDVAIERLKDFSQARVFGVRQPNLMDLF
jgi:hypothetical protein